MPRLFYDCVLQYSTIFINYFKFSFFNYLKIKRNK